MKLTAICRHVLALSVLSGHIPVGWQLQKLISRWENREAKQVILREVNRRRRRLSRLCITTLSTNLLEEPRPFQDKEDIVNIVWPSQTLRLDNNLMFHDIDTMSGYEIQWGARRVCAGEKASYVGCTCMQWICYASPSTTIKWRVMFMLILYFFVVLYFCSCR